MGRCGRGPAYRAPGCPVSTRRRDRGNARATAPEEDTLRQNGPKERARPRRISAAVAGDHEVVVFRDRNDVSRSAEDEGRLQRGCDEEEFERGTEGPGEPGRGQGSD